MRELSPAGVQAINDVAQRHGFSADAVLNMLDAVINGNGHMAQFNHPEFAGYGQWMRGGMTMVSDMFNNHLKGRVDGLCNELANLVANQPDLIRSGSFQSQSQSGGSGSQLQNAYGSGWQQQGGAGPAFSGSGASLFVSPPPGQSADWWGPSLQWPTSTGAQNNVRYAYFAQARRLAIEVHGRVTIYDTLDHQIGGFSQQQSVGGSIGFSSQYGWVDVASLPVISVDGVAPSAAQDARPTAAAAAGGAFVAPAASSAASAAGGGDIFSMIDRLADLHARGVLNAEEFATKKAELLARL